jgi:hypothetical protein
MGARHGRSTDTALDMLVKRFQAVWQADNGVASLLSLDMTGAFDRVVLVQLLHNLRKRSIPQWLVNFISSFLSDRSTSLGFPGFLSSPFSSEQGVPQGSSLSLPFYSCFTMLILLMFATPLTFLLLVLVLLMMQMFWLLGRALRRPVPF